MLQLVILTGLPGTGKSSLAEALGRKLGVPVFAKDWLEATLKNNGLSAQDATDPNLGYVSYELLTTLAERQLQLGQSAILDSVASTAAIRTQWRDLTTKYGATWQVIECVCSNTAQHQARLTVRQRGIPGWSELTWADVERVAAYYAPWQEPRLILDALNPLAHNLALALRYLGDANLA